MKGCVVNFKDRIAENGNCGAKDKFEYEPSFHHSTGEIAAVLALYCNVLGALELGIESWAIISYAIMEAQAEQTYCVFHM